jgi:hypothetical protein
MRDNSEVKLFNLESKHSSLLQVAQVSGIWSYQKRKHLNETFQRQAMTKISQDGKHPKSSIPDDVIGFLSYHLTHAAALWLWGQLSL